MNNQVPIIGQSQPPKNQMTLTDKANIIADSRTKVFQELSKNQLFLQEAAVLISALANSIRNCSDATEDASIIAASNIVAKFV